MDKKTGFVSAQETAERLGVTVRAVQKWAAAGKIPGAEKIGRTWFIPCDVILEELSTQEESKRPQREKEHHTSRTAMPFLNASYEPGHAMKYIENIEDEDSRNIALGEYYFFSGKSEQASRILEPYLDHDDEALRYSAALVSVFANLACGHIHLTKFAMSKLESQVSQVMQSEATPVHHAIGTMTATAASVLLHLPIPKIASMEEYLKYLPEGLKVWSCYLLAHKAYLEENYERALTIADMSILLDQRTFPVAEIYVHIIAAIALMNLKRTEEAKERILKAWEMAKPDDLIQPFAEHHGLLQGLIEVCFKKDNAEDFARIISVTYAFSKGWRRIHNVETRHDVADNLTTTEFSVAMLYHRGWSAQEIAAHLELSEHTVRSYIKTIYIKLGITNKKELGLFMLK